MMTAIAAALGTSLPVPPSVSRSATPPRSAPVWASAQRWRARPPASAARRWPGMGSASEVGGMSVPAGWAAAAPGAAVETTLAGSGWTASVDETAMVWAVAA